MFRRPNASESRLEIEVDQRLLSVKARGAPLGDILRSISERAGFEIHIKGDLGTAITRSFSDVPLDEGIRALVGNHTMVITYHPSDGESPPRINVIRVHERANIASRGVPRPHKTATTDDKILLDLNDPQRNVRIRAIRKLAHSKDEADIRLLARVLVEDEDRFVRGNAAVAIGKSNGDYTSTIALALEDEAPSVRINAVRALGHIGGDQAAQILGDILLDNPDRRMRWMASRVLTEQHSETARRALEWGVHDPDHVVRAEVMRSLDLWE